MTIPAADSDADPERQRIIAQNIEMRRLSPEERTRRIWAAGPTVVDARGRFNFRRRMHEEDGA